MVKRYSGKGACRGRTVFLNVNSSHQECKHFQRLAGFFYLEKKSCNMEHISLNDRPGGHKAFTVEKNGEQLGEMVVDITEDTLTVHHTEVNPDQEGKGLAGQMLSAMTDYARKHALKVIPLCPYVHAQFKRHPEQYEDIWKK
jgi:uncharacterized protein